MKLNPTARHVLKWLQDKENKETQKNFEEIAEEIDRSPRAVWTALKELEKYGYIETIKIHKYVVKDK